MVVSGDEDSGFSRTIAERNTDDLPPGEVLIRVHYSSLNYKDALSAIGNRGVTKNYPHTPGADASGVVEESGSGQFSPGDRVIVTGYDLGMNTSGGFGEYIRVPASWVVPLPPGLTLREAMIYGTAGFTAGLSVRAVVDFGGEPGRGPILVTGASGGVGSLAVAFLAKLGYRVFASSGKAEAQQYLLDLGAEEVIPREEALDESPRPLLRGRWAGVVDTVGGRVLATALRTTTQRGVVTTCGNVDGAELNITVFPFILRGVRLIGIDSASTPMSVRLPLWELMAGQWKPERLDEIAREVPLEGLDREIELILKGGQKGRVVLAHAR